MPVESDAVSEGDLLDEEEAGIPSVSSKPKLNAKKSKEGFSIDRVKIAGNIFKTFENQ